MRRVRNIRFLMSFVAFAIIFAGVFNDAIIAEGVPAMPGVRTHMQKDGSVVSYQVLGDEFLNYMIDTNGNLLAFGDGEELFYADWISEREFLDSMSPHDEDCGENAVKFHSYVVPTNRKPIGSYINAYASPLRESDMRSLKTPVPKYLLEYAGKQMEERDTTWRKWHSKKLLRDAESAKSPLSSVVERNLLIVYVRFENESNTPELQQKALSNTDIYNLVFNEVRQSSVAHYYKSVTDGGVKFIRAKETEGTKDDGIIRVTLPGSHKNWKDNFPSFRTDVITPALAKASSFINLRDYCEGTHLSSEELSIMFIIHGYESSNGSEPGIWGHASYGGGLGTIDNISIASYCAFGAFQSKGSDPQPFTAGVVVHELGHHSFGFFDLYNIGNNRTRGITDYWSVMGMGTWGALPGEPNGSSPTCLDAYHLSTLFPPTATVSAANLTTGQQFSLAGASQFIKLETAFPKQYFLLQARGNVGYDRGIQRRLNSWSNPYGGLMIYHIDEEKAPESTWHLGENTDWETHPFIDIEEAHGGQQHLQRNSSAITADDLFYGTNNKFDSSSDPNSNLYDGISARTQNIASLVSVSEITPSVTGQNTPDGRVTVAFRVGTNNRNFEAPNINTAILPGGTIGVAYSQTLEASGTAPITWSFENGNLPGGLTLSNAGLISGAPTAEGTFNFTVKATNAYGSVTKPLSIIVSAMTTNIVTIQPKSATIAVGETQTLIATLAQVSVSNQTLIWKSNNTSVATVNASGVITGVNAGTAIISVSLNNSGSSDSCVVTVLNSNLRYSNPQYSSNIDYAASKMVDIKATELEITGGKVIVKKSITEAIAKKQLGADDFEVVCLPWFESEVRDSGVAAVKIPVTGSQLNANYPRNIMLLKVLSGSVGEFLKYVGSEADYGDGSFTLLSKGSEAPYTGYINPNASYDLVIFIRDGGKFDLDKITNGFVVDPLAIIYETKSKGDEKKQPDKRSQTEGGGGGCSAGFSSFVLLLSIVPFAKKKKGVPDTAI